MNIDIEILVFLKDDKQYIHIFWVFLQFSSFLGFIMVFLVFACMQFEISPRTEYVRASAPAREHTASRIAVLQVCFLFQEFHSHMEVNLNFSGMGQLGRALGSKGLRKLKQPHQQSWTATPNWRDKLSLVQDHKGIKKVRDRAKSVQRVWQQNPSFKNIHNFFFQVSNLAGQASSCPGPGRRQSKLGLLGISKLRVINYNFLRVIGIFRLIVNDSGVITRSL